MENINCAIVTGETNSIERRNSIEMFKDTSSGLNIIINFGVLTTGLMPKIKCRYYWKTYSICYII